MSGHHFRKSLTPFVGVLLLSSIDSHAKTVPAPDFGRDIRPILSDNCFRCHGPEEKSRKGKLRLDDRDSATRKEAIVPGKPDESELIYRLTAEDPEEKMPPAETHKTVSPEQIELLRRWVASGAKYEPHWSYTPVQRPELPKTADAKWAKGAIDQFILARLETAGMTPSRPADRNALLRRLSLDLIGLPPTPAEIQAFNRDRSPNAFAKQVERLLASPHYGERMSVPWLDAVRFADTVGYHGDQNQRIFPYRDYVIDSFNRNKPFDQFTIEQIAGDLLPNPTIEQQVATGFNRLNMMTREGGAQPKEYLAKYSADRVRTVSTAWLGSTIACSECHDHKFDPFSQRDFYALGAFFGDVKQWGVYNDYTYTPNPDLPGFTNDHPFPPEIVVTSPFLVQREASLQAQRKRLLATTVKTLSSGSGRLQLDAWASSLQPFLAEHPDGWAVEQRPEAKTVDPTSKSQFTVSPDGAILRTGEVLKREKVQIRLRPEAGSVAALRLELLPHEAFAQSSLRPGKDSVEIRVTLDHQRSGAEPTRITFHRSNATSRLPFFSNGDELLDVHPSWKLDTKTATAPQHAVFLPNQPLAIEAGDVLIVTIDSEDMGCFRLATSPLAGASALDSGVTPGLGKVFAEAAKRRSNLKAAPVVTSWLLSAAADPTLADRFKTLNRDILNCRQGNAPTLVTVALEKPAITRVLPRGNWQDESGEIVAPATPHFLPQPKSANGSAQLNRLDLARWLVSRENPLTARTFVNRLWKQFFGAGLANQLEDLGAQGEAPSHPELMNWLAAEFMESGWDVKHLVRLIVMSATYQQDATNRPELREQDPNNRLLAHQNPRRIDAEFVRDNALAISGLLNPAVGGPSVFPYQPADYYESIQFPSRTYVASHDDQQYRRGLYTHWQRSFLHPMLANFDAPSREECTMDRPLSTTPQQALTLLNDPTFVEAARAYAQKLLLTPKIKTDAQRVKLAIETALLRPARDRETASLLEFLATQRTYYAAHEDEAMKLLQRSPGSAPNELHHAEHAAWTSLARVVLNLHETITRY